MPNQFILERPIRFIVRGRVINSAGSPISCIINVWDFNLSKPVELTSSQGVETDKNGAFTLSYDTSGLSALGKTAADLEFKVFGSDGRLLLEPIKITRLLNGARNPLNKPPILFKAEKEEIVEIPVGEEAYRGPTEFENLISAIKATPGRPFTRKSE